MSPNVPPFEQKSTEEHEVFARHQAHKLGKRAVQNKEDVTKMPTIRTSSRTAVPSKNTVQELTIHTRDDGIYRRRDVY